MKIEDVERNLNVIVESGVKGITPALFLIQEEGDKVTLVDLSIPFSRPDYHQVFHKMGIAARLTAPAITSIIMVSEGWAKAFPAGTDMSETKRPSQYADKKEIVQISQLDVGAKVCKSIIYTIVRDSNNIISLTERSEGTGESPLMENFFVGYGVQKPESVN